MPVEFRFTVSAGPKAPGIARHELARRTAPYLDDGPHDDAILALSEIVTNVVRHGGVGDGAPITIGVEPVPGRVRIIVEQPTAMPSVTAGYEPTVDGGIGLAIVEKVAAGWGIDNGPPGRVWFDVSP